MISPEKSEAEAVPEKYRRRAWGEPSADGTPDATFRAAALGAA